jgi:hypothetical protein
MADLIHKELWSAKIMHNPVGNVLGYLRTADEMHIGSSIDREPSFERSSGPFIADPC